MSFLGHQDLKETESEWSHHWIISAPKKHWNQQLVSYQLANLKTFLEGEGTSTQECNKKVRNWKWKRQTCHPVSLLNGNNKKLAALKTQHTWRQPTHKFPLSQLQEAGGLYKYTNVELTLVVIVVVTHAIGISISFLFGNNLITHLQGWNHPPNNRPHWRYLSQRHSMGRTEYSSIIFPGNIQYALWKK